MSIRKLIKIKLYLIGFAVIFALGFVFNSYAAYDVLDRFKLLEDKFKTEDMLRPFGHDFLLGTTVLMNKNLFDLIDDAEGVDSGTTDDDKIQNARDVIDKYKDTEQALRAGINVGIPLFSFTAWGWKIVPDIRISAHLGANIGIKTERLSLDDILNYLSNEVPDEVKVYASDLNQTQLENADGDIIQALLTANKITDAEANAIGLEKYYFDVDYVNQDIPNIHLYTKLEAKGGLLLNYSKRKRWFGYLNLYALSRTDFLLKVNALMLAKDSDFLDGADETNTQNFLMLDYSLGYNWKRYSVTGVIEEIKIKRFSDSLEKGGDLSYKIDPLIRVHADAKYELPVVTLLPFVGIHKRGGYSLSQGIYAGLDVGSYIWKDRIGLQARGMLDSEHLTFSPRIKLWFMQLEYSLKMPIVSEVDGIKPSVIHSAEFRVFF